MAPKIHCPKCRSTSWETRTEHLEAGAILQVVRCLTCSWRAEREVNRSAMAAPRVQEAARETDRARVRTCKEAAPPGSREGVQTLHPCPAPGCTNRYSDASALGLCNTCTKRLRQWEISQRTRPAPLQKINGHWFSREALLIPADPGTLPAPVPVPVARPRFAASAEQIVTEALQKLADQGNAVAERLLNASLKRKEAA